jgi:predicted house-cleaning noncanonical NTP pyrophosphatase (MazG superfamily)
VLDAAFGKDNNRLRKDSGLENMAILGKLVLTVTQADTESKSNIMEQRDQMAWQNEYLEWLLS